MNDRDDAASAFRHLLHQAVRGVTDLVERSHDQVAGHVVRAARAVGVGKQAEAFDAVRRLLTQASLVGVRSVNAAVEVAGDVAQDALRQPGQRGPVIGCAPLRSDAVQTAAGAVDAAVGALCGAIGDRAGVAGSALDLGFGLRWGDAGGLGDAMLPDDDDALRAMLAEQLQAPAREIGVYVHGLCATEWGFCFGAAANWGDPSTTFARLLHESDGLLPLYARYNSGRPIGQNGAALAAWLERLDAALDALGHPDRRYWLIGHSMGGLVARAALADGLAREAAFCERVVAVATLGTPHAGAPLERLVASLTQALSPIALPAASIPKTLLEMRSAGIRDLAAGEPAWTSPAATRWLLLAATLAESDAGAVLGDGMVTRASALAEAAALPEAMAARTTRATVAGVAHAAISNHPAVHARLAAFVREVREA
ncbi:MAG: hypothetical protein RIT45_2001 [Pseudomonadota bacterium]